MLHQKYNEKNLKNSKKIHFIGIGGSGMFPLVQILHSEGFEITGSDNNHTETVRLEENLGIPVIIGQKASNILGSDLIVYSAAIQDDNPELIAAIESSIPTISRSTLLGIITQRYKKTIGIAGTHGKTTTSSMLTQILLDASLDPSAILGGKLASINGNGRAGKSDLMVVESCEFANTFLKIQPWISILLNVDADHLEYFKTMDNLIYSFHQFLSKTSGPIFYNGDDSNTLKAIEDLSQQKFSFGASNSNDYFFSDLENKTMGEKFCQTFSVWEKGKFLLRATLHVPGKHNVFNALAAIAVSRYLELSPEQIQVGLLNFTGASRRFEIIGHQNGFTIADDYAHHPTEIAATLQAAREMDYNKIWTIFQPFTYSRTIQHMDEFAEVLKQSDHVLLTPIMGGREKNIHNIKSEDLAEKIPNSVVFPSFEEVAIYAYSNAKKGDLVLTMGCGDVYKVAKMINEKTSS